MSSHFKTSVVYYEYLARFCQLGALAQLGARLNGIQKAVGSNPICSIICGKEGPTKWEDSLSLGRRPRTEFVLKRVCSFICGKEGSTKWEDSLSPGRRPRNKKSELGNKSGFYFL